MVDIKQATAAINVPPARFFLLYVTPVALGTTALSVALALLLPDLFTGWMQLVLWGIPPASTGIILAYPFTVAEGRRHRIDHNMHYFITHLGVLATSDVPRVELFRILGNKKQEYGPLAEECEKIATLVLKWNMSLAEATRFVARRTPSQLLADFLERFAFGIESGAEMGPYLAAEQEVVMAEYETMYKSTLVNIEGLKQMFNGVMMTIIFMAMFALVMPILIGGSTTMVLWGVIGATAAVELAFLWLVRNKVPPDAIWADLGTRSPLWRRVKWALPASVVAVAALAVVLPMVTNWPAAIVVALAATPLAVPGWLASKEEALLKRRDDNYPAFMRSLGASTAARGGDAREVLRHLRHHDFGPLTQNIRNLFTRLQMRVDDDAAWHYFTSEAGSRLVERFTQMYDEAIDAGGSPDEGGIIISDNMVRILGLRKLRYQGASSFRGTLLGIAAGVAFALFIGIGVLSMLLGLFNGIATPEGAPVEIPAFVHVDSVDVPMMEGLALGMLALNAAASAILVRFIDGGTALRGLQDFTVILWISNITALVSGNVMTSIGGGAIT